MAFSLHFRIYFFAFLHSDCNRYIVSDSVSSIQIISLASSTYLLLHPIRLAPSTHPLSPSSFLLVLHPMHPFCSLLIIHPIPLAHSTHLSYFFTHLLLPNPISLASRLHPYLFFTSSSLLFNLPPFAPSYFFIRTSCSLTPSPLLPHSLNQSLLLPQPIPLVSLSYPLTSSPHPMLPKPTSLDSSGSSSSQM